MEDKPLKRVKLLSPNLCFLSKHIHQVLLKLSLEYAFFGAAVVKC